MADDDDLMKKAEALGKAAEKLGLYTEQVAVLGVQDDDDEPQPLLAMRFNIGRVAFQPRTQDPDQDSVNREIRKIEAESEQHEFGDLKARMQRNIKAGRDPLDDGEDD